MADGRDDRQGGELFKPISLDERLAKPAPRPTRTSSPSLFRPGQLYAPGSLPCANEGQAAAYGEPTGAYRPAETGQLTGAYQPLQPYAAPAEQHSPAANPYAVPIAYPQSPIPAEAANAAAPFRNPLIPDASAPAASLPPYLQKRPSLSPLHSSSEAQAAAHSRIASTFGSKPATEATPPISGEAAPWPSASQSALGASSAPAHSAAAPVYSAPWSGMTAPAFQPAAPALSPVVAAQADASQAASPRRRSRRTEGVPAAPSPEPPPALQPGSRAVGEPEAAQASAPEPLYSAAPKHRERPDFTAIPAYLQTPGPAARPAPSAEAMPLKPAMPQWPINTFRNEIDAFFNEPPPMKKERAEEGAPPLTPQGAQPDDPYAPYETESLPPGDGFYPPVYDEGFEPECLPPAPVPEEDAEETGYIPPIEFFTLDASADGEAYSPEPPAAAPAYVPPAPAKAGSKPASRGAKPTKPPKPPIRWQRVAALIAAAAMLVFCGVVGGRIVYRMATNEREMEKVKAAYREQYGSTMEQDSARVDLPPPDQTFPPTVTPQPVITPVPTPIIAFNDNAANSLNHRSIADEATQAPAMTAAARTRLSRYPDNTLRNILTSMADLKDEYPDVAGRLVIDGVLDEIVVQRNNTYYLTRNYRGTVAAGGAVFIDESCSLKTPPENLLLRGQGSVAGKAFAPLWQYQTGGESFATGACYATLTTLYEEARYVLLAVVVTDSDPSDAHYFNYASHPTFATDQQMLSYVEDARDHSLYRFSTDIAASDRLLTLATVSSNGNEQCIALLFRMLRNGEKGR